MKLLKKQNLIFYVFLSTFLCAKAQEADTSAHDFASKGLKVHAFLMNMTDVAKVTGFKKPFILSASGLQVTSFTKENGWWKNGMFSMYMLNTFGDNPTTDYVHDYQMFDNIESFPDTNNHIDFKNGQLNYRTFIYTLYYQHFFKNSRLLVGQYDLNFDFAFSNVGLNFINSSFGVQPTITYNVPSFSTYPFTNLTLRYEYNLGDYNIRAAIAQGMGGNNLTNPHGTKYSESFKEGGLFMITEFERVKIKSDFLMSDYKLGFWGHTGSKSLKFTNFTDTLDTKGHFNYGAYFIGDKFLRPEKGDSSQGLYAFVDLGWAPNDYNIFNYYAGGGFSYTGLFPKRDADILALGIANPFFSKGLQRTKGFTQTEKAIELNYNFVTKKVNIQPCVQYIMNIAGDPTNNPNCYAFMVRVTSHQGLFY